MTYRIVLEPEFRERLSNKLSNLKMNVKSVMGPGRSGAVASVYASHFLGIPFLPSSLKSIPQALKPILIIDTAVFSGKTLAKLNRRFQPDCISLYLFKEPPIIKFWYETCNGKAKKVNKIK